LPLFLPERSLPLTSVPRPETSTPAPESLVIVLPVMVTFAAWLTTPAPRVIFVLLWSCNRLLTMRAWSLEVPKKMPSPELPQMLLLVTVRPVLRAELGAYAPDWARGRPSW